MSSRTDESISCTEDCFIRMEEMVSRTMDLLNPAEVGFCRTEDLLCYAGKDFRQGVPAVSASPN